MSIRILVVDDHQWWTRHVSEELQNDPRYRVIGEAADGLDAVRAVERLKPDLLVLDVGLPTINGIEAARRILADAPDTRILFLSEQRSPDIAQAALRTGAYGYIVKSDAGGELLPAVAAIAGGKSFVGARLATEVEASRGGPRSAQRIRHHDVVFTEDESSLIDRYARFAGEAMTVGATACVVATPPRLHAVMDKLQASGMDFDEAVAQGRYVPLDANELLSNFMVDGWPDEARFTRLSTDLISAAAAASRHDYHWVVACGECAPQLWKQGRTEAAIRIEHLWDDLAARSGVDLLCGYSLGPAAHADEHVAIGHLCDVHSSAHWDR